MIVLGADTHKRSHTVAAVSAASGELIGEQTVQVGAKGFAALVVWARELGAERVWALEDCRHVSGSLERFLIARGERVVRVPTRLMANARRSSRERGKSDRIDAVCVARRRSGMFRRDLTGAWHRPQQAVSAGRPLNRSGGGRGQ